MTSRAAVAAGSTDTAAAAAEVLGAGGNAYDAVVAAGFAAAVAEPGLSSPGGGGFLLARLADGRETLFDFFVDAPGHGRPTERLQPHFEAVTVLFSGAEQVFHAGYGSVAVPGALSGFLRVHERLGRLDLAEVVAPARRLAYQGCPLAPAQAQVVDLIGEILMLTPEGRALFAPGGRLLREGDLLRNEAYGDFLGEVAAGRVTGVDSPAFADPLVSAMDGNGGLVTHADLRGHAVVERDPLVVTYRGARIATNPPPSFGGRILASALAELGDGGATLGSGPDGYVRVVRALAAATLREKSLRTARSSKGTTHVSVVDADGNVAAMTTSNGSCSGVFVPGTGVQLNNVLGEADLHPEGFHATPPGVRIGSMMSPSVITFPDGRSVALGSGGSERIRSAVLAGVVNLVDRGWTVGDAVRAPRVHWDGSGVQAEPGLDAGVVAALERHWPVNVWSRTDLYFGGVNAVARDTDGTAVGVGDPRRGGGAVAV